MNLISLIILGPLLGFFILACSQGRWSHRVVASIGVGSIAISAGITIYVIFDFFYNICSDYHNFVFIQELWTWFVINDLRAVISLRLDGLSLAMLSMIVGIGLVIHIYAVWYMKRYEGYSRFFSYTNFFMFNMILLVLSDNLLLMYFGWEGVGFCSYLLIGFCHLNIKNGMAARKAFIMTRCGDICLIFALFMIYDQYHTLSLSELLVLQRSCNVSNNIAVWISCMLLIGALVKSAQIPLQSWLIAAMVGPTPVSALIHAATMVTSGVYLISRMNSFFLGTPSVLYIVGMIGAITVLLFSCSALLQSNIKKILAYSTISQIGYMFIALGGGHWVAAIFHLITHAVFKALLFLAAGSLIYVCGQEQNIFKMGGLYKSVPLIYICFLVGGASLSAFPIVTAGFYSKELILLQTLSNHDYFFWISGLIGAFLTSMYVFRMIFIIFHGQRRMEPYIFDNNFFQSFPLIILLLCSTCIGGWVKLPLLAILFDDANNNIFNYEKIYFEIISSILIIFGIWVASYFWLHVFFDRNKKIRYSSVKNVVTRYIMILCYYGWGFHRVFKIAFIQPYLFVVHQLVRCDLAHILSNIIISLFYWIRDGLECSVNGKLNWYISSINIGAIIVLFIILTYMQLCV